jgi:hypothetical protein
MMNLKSESGVNPIATAEQQATYIDIPLHVHASKIQQKCNYHEYDETMLNRSALQILCHVRVYESHFGRDSFNVVAPNLWIWRWSVIDDSSNGTGSGVALSW